MNRLTRILAFFVTVLTLSSAQAYFVGILKDTVIDPNKITHVLVSGRGTDLGLLPQHSAISVGLRIKAVNPTHQVILLSVLENAENEGKLPQRGITIVKRNDAVKFYTDTILPEIMKFKKIESIHYFGHNSPHMGTQTDGDGYRFDFLKPSVWELKSKMTGNAYMFIHGCNAGWVIAPLVSEKLGIPVAGAFTGSRFERLHDVGQFYVFDPLKAPEWALGIPNLDWAKVNKISFPAPQLCDNGGCFRMRPENTGYNGHWGNMTAAGLGFYKFFCVNNNESECQRRMALALMYELTTKSLSFNSPRADFIEAAKDFVCPPSKNRQLTKQCYAAMETALNGGAREYTSVLEGPAIQCSFKSCDVQFTCNKTAGVWQAGSCIAKNLGPARTTTQANEFLAYVKGYDVLQQSLQK